MLLLAAPTALPAQQQASDVGRAELAVFAWAHFAMNQARDAFHAAIADAHEEQAIERAREAFDEAIASALEEHELTRERYDEILLVISLDEEARATVEGMLAELAREAEPNG